MNVVLHTDLTAMHNKKLTIAGRHGSKCDNLFFFFFLKKEKLLIGHEDSFSAKFYLTNAKMPTNNSFCDDAFDALGTRKQFKQTQQKLIFFPMSKCQITEQPQTDRSFHYKYNLQFLLF